MPKQNSFPVRYHQPRSIATKFRTDCAIAPHAVRYPGAENRNKEANAAPKFAQVYINIYIYIYVCGEDAEAACIKSTAET